MTRPVILLILDGWGISEKKEYNAIAMGDTPVFDRLNKEKPYLPIHASGVEVGLPAGQMGNSEVGHLNIGAGRVVYQDLLRVSVSIDDGSFYENDVLLSAVARSREKNSSLHLCGLVSDGGVHSQMEHLFALLELAKRQNLTKVFVHVFMDGRDTPPDSGLEHIHRLEKEMGKIGAGVVASIQGRFYGMDRDTRWTRTEKAYNLLVEGKGNKYGSATDAIRASYDRDVMDEFIEPVVIVDRKGEPAGRIKNGDEVIMFNFRSDRMRQITKALYDPGFSDFKRETPPQIGISCLTEYDARFGIPMAFETIVPENGLGKVLSENGLKQLRAAETEKYAHVTFFFNGGVEKPFKGEDRKLIPSPRVRTYDLKPEMSCVEVTNEVVDAIEKDVYRLIVVNLANGDMVGHTGILEAAIKAVNVVDASTGRIIKACEKAGAHLIITSDHGNIETMVDENGKPMTAHTTNQVPFYYLGDDSVKLRDEGRLADIAPTILRLLDIQKPDEMTGKSLIG